MTCRSGWGIKVILAVSLAVIGAGGISIARADVSPGQVQVASVAATTTLNEALPDGGDSEIVKAAILKSDQDKYAGDTSHQGLSGSSTLQDVAAEQLIVKITTNLDSYAALEKVADQFSGLVVNNQQNFDSAEMTAITQAFLANRTTGTELAALGFSNDGVTTADLATLLQTIDEANSAATIKYLLLNRNPITDFSSWVTFKSTAATKDKIAGLNADVLKNPDGQPISTGITLAPQMLKDGIIELPFTELNEFNGTFLTSSTDNVVSGLKFYNQATNHDDIDQAAQLDSENVSGVDQALQSEVISSQKDFPYWSNMVGIDETHKKINLSTYDVLFYDQEQIYQTNTNAPEVNSYVEDCQNQGYTFKYPDLQERTTPPNGEHLFIAHVPAGAKQVQIRVLTEALGNTATYTQIYTIPIKLEPTTPTAFNHAESSSSSADSATIDTKPVAKVKLVYATKKIGLYQHPDFTKTTRQRWYSQQPRVHRPMFKVTGEAASKQGTPRYLVKDVNRESKTYGKTGYITKRATYVTPAYYAKAPAKVTIIAPKGVNAYRRVALTGKVKHYRQGQVLPIVGITQHHLTTRFQLQDGTYVTANKKLVQSGRLPMVKKVAAKTKINRYQDVNLKRQSKVFRKGTQIAVLGYDFSTHGAQRYRVAGGYVTANPKLVKVIK
ncbi:DUF5776 domain-containing protein [Levilactobacillus hammesii]|uniref:DUF5776 domain-containing protein n=1 Tax=Levilactobacillus hammesii TaxID=267633 RepID=UPI000709843A|nr:DUF5776 domain-containing protein [Levilactobacillus hammesii]